MSCQEKLGVYDKRVYFLLGKTYFTVEDGCQNVLVFAPMLNLLIFDNNEEVTNGISTLVSPQKFKPFDVNLALTMSNFVNGRV